MPAINPNATFCPACTAMSQEIERLRKQLSARLQELEHIKQERLTWAMVCDHDCPACTALDDAIRGDPPAEHPVPEQPPCRPTL